jgi:type I restriction enzyme S subunit
MEKKVPEGWGWKRLGDLITYRKGRKPDILLEQKDEGDLPYLTAGYFRTGTPKNFVPLDYHSSCVRCDLNDIVLIWDGSNAGDVFKGLTGVLASTMIKIEPKVQQFLPNFAFLFLKTQFQTLKSQTTGSSIPHISKSVFENLKVPLPPLETQRKIVAILEKAEETKRLRMQADELTNQLLQSVFLEMFGDPVKNPKGWEIVKLEKLLRNSILNGLYLPKDKYVKNGGIEMVHMSDAFYGIVKRGNLKQVNINEKEIEKYNVDYNDILIARRSLNYEGSAKPCRVHRSSKPIVFESSLIKLSPDQNKILPTYLYYYLNDERARKVFVFKYVTKSTISGINQNGLKKIDILVPPIELQQKFVQIVEKVESMRQKQLQSQQQTNNLFNALMQKAFKGELTL